MCYGIIKALLILATILITFSPSKVFAQNATTPQIKNEGKINSNQGETEKSPPYVKVKTEEQKKKKYEVQKANQSPMVQKKSEKQSDVSSPP